LNSVHYSVGYSLFCGTRGAHFFPGGSPYTHAGSVWARSGVAAHERASFWWIN